MADAEHACLVVAVSEGAEPPPAAERVAAALGSMRREPPVAPASQVISHDLALAMERQTLAMGRMVEDLVRAEAARQVRGQLVVETQRRAAERGPLSAALAAR